MRLKKIQNRIVEILNILSDEEREKKIANGITMHDFEKKLEKLNRPLQDELRILERKEQYSYNRHQFYITFAVGLGSIIISSIVAFGVPKYEEIRKQQAEIQSVYKQIVTNADIYISNINNKKNLEKSNQVSNLPESFLEYNNISDETKKIIQDKMGLVQYRFFLYYIQQTNFLNQEIQELKSSYIISGLNSKEYLNTKAVYFNTVDYLAQEKLNTKLNYQIDSGCLQYFFEHEFSYLKTDGRGKMLECLNDSLNRIFYHFGYLPADTPSWLVPQLKTALNERESGLGDRVIQDNCTKQKCSY